MKTFSFIRISICTYKHDISPSVQNWLEVFTKTASQTLLKILQTLYTFLALVVGQSNNKILQFVVIQINLNQDASIWDITLPPQSSK